MPHSQKHSQKHSIDIDNFDSSRIKTSPFNLCSYLPNQISKLNFLLLENNEVITSSLYAHLLQHGFRRSGYAFYRPNCQHCLQCISCRVLTNNFKPSRRYRRVLNRNINVTVNITVPISTKTNTTANSEHYALYQKYINARHKDGDMFPPSLHTFEQFLLHSPANTLFIECRETDTGKLIAVAVTDQLDNGLSSVYTFFDPSEHYNKRSLGVYCILKQIEIAQQLGLDYVYLGYWIPTVKKMSYKTDFAPLELFINNQWQCFTETPNSDDILNILNTKPLIL